MFNPIFNSGSDPNSIQTIQGPYVVPEAVVNPGPGSNLNSGWLQSAFFPWQQTVPQPPGYLNSPPPNDAGITKDNWQQMALAEIERRNNKAGKEIPKSMQLAIVDAYRQMAGLPPISYNLDDQGAAILNDFQSPTVGQVLQSAFEPVNVANNLTNTFNSISEGVKDALPSIFGTVQILGLAAVVLGTVYLLKVK